MHNSLALLNWRRNLALLAWLCCFCLQAQAWQAPADAYVCPMHPDVTARAPGACPKCKMALRRKTTAPTPPAASESEVGAVPHIPDVVVSDQHGAQLRFFSDLVKGKTVAINFIFTTCTTICPPLSATFRQLQTQLGPRVGKDLQLISISVDPTTDIPARLRSFAAKFDAQPGWSFVTGEKAQIDMLLRALGAGVGDKNDHTPMVLIGNERAAYWTRAYGLAPAQTLAQTMREAAAKPPASTTPANLAARYFPNTTLLTEDGRTVRFFDDLLAGKTVLINFMFATCTGVCSPMTANLVKVQTALGSRVGRDIQMLSLTVDPLIDTPATLKRYAESFHVQPGWHFLTGKKEDMDTVLAKLGGYVTDKNQHNNLLIIGNVATGEWVKVFALSKPEEIAKVALQIADGSQSEPANVRK
ncbi:MAG: SCO family protein [Acidobacteriota bacterium]